MYGVVPIGGLFYIHLLWRNISCFFAPTLKSYTFSATSTQMFLSLTLLARSAKITPQLLYVFYGPRFFCPRGTTSVSDTLSRFSPPRNLVILAHCKYVLIVENKNNVPLPLTVSHMHDVLFSKHILKYRRPVNIVCIVCI